MGIRIEVISGEHKGCAGPMVFENKYYYFIIPESDNEKGEKSLLVIEKSKAKEIHNYNPDE